ncbi:hypothetical protein OQA88_12238 [Cercophora sp. LCS_1]
MGLLTREAMNDPLKKETETASIVLLPDTTKEGRSTDQLEETFTEIYHSRFGGKGQYQPSSFNHDAEYESTSAYAYYKHQKTDFVYKFGFQRRSDARWVLDFEKMEQHLCSCEIEKCLECEFAEELTYKRDCASAASTAAADKMCGCEHGKGEAE